MGIQSGAFEKRAWCELCGETRAFLYAASLHRQCEYVVTSGPRAEKGYLNECAVYYAQCCRSLPC